MFLIYIAASAGLLVAAFAGFKVTWDFWNEAPLEGGDWLILATVTVLAIAFSVGAFACMDKGADGIYALMATWTRTQCVQTDDTYCFDTNCQQYVGGNNNGTMTNQCGTK